MNIYGTSKCWNMLTALLAFIIRSLSNVSFSWFLVHLSVDARAFINLNFMYPLFYSTVLSASTAEAAALDERDARALSPSRSKILTRRFLLKHSDQSESLGFWTLSN
jgi:hypothetical protein